MRGGIGKSVIIVLCLESFGLEIEMLNLGIDIGDGKKKTELGEIPGGAWHAEC